MTDILRGELGFDGVVITDSLAMGAITREFDSSKAAGRALEAGCDILLGSESFTEAFDAVLAEMGKGTISGGRIEKSVRRILTLKEAYGPLGE